MTHHLLGRSSFTSARAEAAQGRSEIAGIGLSAGAAARLGRPPTIPLEFSGLTFSGLHDNLPPNPDDSKNDQSIR